MLDSIKPSESRESKSRTADLRLRFWFYFVLAVLGFAATCAIEEFLLALSPTFRIVDDGVARLPTKTEIFESYVVSPFIGGLFSGVIAVLLLCLPALWFYKATSLKATYQSIILAVGFGFGSGAMLSIASWAISGGWGPPRLIPSCVAGAFITPILVLIRRQAESGDNS